MYIYTHVIYIYIHIYIIKFEYVRQTTNIQIEIKLLRLYILHRLFVVRVSVRLKYSESYTAMVGQQQAGWLSTLLILRCLCY